MAIRTKTYIAGDWTGDRDLIDQIYKWNDSSRWALNFTDAHALTQARDTSLNCSIKKSLWERLESSKTFVLVVGLDTLGLRAGSCAYCNDYRGLSRLCRRGHSIDLRSYVQYECEYAAKRIGRIVVLYNCSYVEKGLCPDPLRDCGVHLPAYRINEDYSATWLYQDIKKAICG